MEREGGARHPARRIADEPEIAALVALVREGRLSGDRLAAEIERRQLPLFTVAKGGGEHDTDGNG